MTSRELEIFHAVMSSRSLTEAAQALGISQPALSKALKRLEDKLRMPLFRRVKGRLRPTLEAESLFPEAARLIQEISRLSRSAAELRGGETGLLRIAASASIGMSIMPSAIAEFSATFPDVRIVTNVVPAANGADLVAGGHVDASFCLSPITMPGVVMQSVATVPMVCALNANDPLTQRSAISVKDLMSVNMISYGPNTYHGQLLDDAFAREGLQRPIGIELVTSIQAPALVLNGAGVAIIDSFMESAGFSGLVWRPLQTPVMLPVNIITSTTKATSRLANRFLEVFRTTLEKVKR